MAQNGSDADLAAENERLRNMLECEKRRSAQLEQELKRTKEQSLHIQQELELEEEKITNRLLARLDDLKKEKQVLAAEVEQAERYLADNLQRRLLQLQQEKVELENKLEQEQEYISLKLTKQLEKLGAEKAALQQEKAHLKRQVADLSSAAQRLRQEKVELERVHDFEEENITNRLQRQLQQVTTAYRAMEARLEAAGMSPRADGVSAIDHTTEWVYGRSPSRISDRLTGTGRRERSQSVSSTSSLRTEHSTQMAAAVAAAAAAAQQQQQQQGQAAALQQQASSSSFSGVPDLRRTSSHGASRLQQATPSESLSDLALNMGRQSLQ